MLKNPIVVNPINTYFLKFVNFKEQIAVLYNAGKTVKNGKTYMKVIRSWVGVGTTSKVTFNYTNGTSVDDTYEGWKWIDQQIEKEEVVGVFHTHPHRAKGFSCTDRMMQRGFAKANGKKLLWHGVQTPDSKAHLVCYHMPFVPHIFVYDFGWIDYNLEDEVLLLPMPIEIEPVENFNNVHLIRC